MNHCIPIAKVDQPTLSLVLAILEEKGLEHLNKLLIILLTYTSFIIIIYFLFLHQLFDIQLLKSWCIVHGELSSSSCELRWHFVLGWRTEFVDLLILTDEDLKVWKTRLEKCGKLFW